MIVDTHLHIIDLKALRYPWLSSEPALNRDFSYAEYAREARRVGIAQSLFMEVDVAPDEIETEIAYVENLAEDPESLLCGAIAACRPEDEDFPALLDRLRERTFVKGFRRVLHVMPDGLSESRLFRDNVGRLSGTGLTFDLCMLPRQVNQAIALIDAAPDVTFILDHCGVPDIAGEAFNHWKKGIAEIARRDNVIGKLSGICAYASKADWTVESLRPYADETIGAFGFDRMVWGSDWPVCTLTASLSTWVAATHSLLEGSTPEEKQKLLAHNARRLWHI